VETAPACRQAIKAKITILAAGRGERGWRGRGQNRGKRHGKRGRKRGREIGVEKIGERRGGGCITASYRTMFYFLQISTRAKKYGAGDASLSGFVKMLPFLTTVAAANQIFFLDISE
jgi:hypothetical protein